VNSAPLILLTDCNSVLVGNVANNYNTGGTIAVIHVVRGTIEAYNNRLDLEGDNWAQYWLSSLGFWLESASGDIVNNSITLDIYAAYGIGNLEYGVCTQGSGGRVTVRGNAITLTHANDGGNPVRTIAVEDDANEITSCSYCCVNANSGAPLVGVNGVAMIFADPQLTNSRRNPDLTLAPSNIWLLPVSGSPCLNVGPPDPVYNNTDGTRSTIGYTGGPYFVPANYTNDNPMVFWLFTTNQTVLKGLQGTVPIRIGAAAGH
jgi:hypothetical protein